MVTPAWFLKITIKFLSSRFVPIYNDASEILEYQFTILSLALETIFYFANATLLKVFEIFSHVFSYIDFPWSFSSVGKCQFMSLAQFTFGRLSQYFSCSFSWVMYILEILSLDHIYCDCCPHLLVFNFWSYCHLKQFNIVLWFRSFQCDFYYMSSQKILSMASSQGFNKEFNSALPS